LADEDIKEIIKLKQEKPNEVNEELLRQSQWMQKKLYLIDVTSQNMKKLRDDNINTILNQNTKLIEECNLLRTENETQKKEIKKIEKLLHEAIRKREKLRQANQNQNPAMMKQLNDKYDENQEKLKSQQIKLSNIKVRDLDCLMAKESIEEIMVHNKDSTKSGEIPP